MYTKKKNVKDRRRKFFLLVRLWMTTLLFLILAIYIGLKVSEDGTYYLVDYTDNAPQTLETYHHYQIAEYRFERSESSSICIKDENGKRLAIKEGIVDFNTKDVSENTSFEVEGSDDQGYTNGSYGADALYLETSSDGKRVKFLMSGVEGWVDISDVKLKVVTNDTYISYYEVSDKVLYHNISTDVGEETYLNIALDDAPSFMESDTRYYSYDGHWFYTNLSDMAKDYRNDTHDNAINDEAYYNFYQFVPHRSTTTVKSSEYDDYLTETRGITETASTYPCADTQSILYGMGSDFISAQKKYGVNATMMFCVAMNESGYGQSSYAILNYNLFGHSVYDSSPDSASSYTSLTECLKQHAKYFIGEGYANPEDERYNGSWFGDKGTGINRQYASDPYWGEKAASLYYQMGTDDSKDLNLITFEATKDINVYNQKNGNVVYTYEKGSTVSFIVTDEDEEWYTVTSEAPIKHGQVNTEETYSKTQNKVYVKIEDVQ